jgi:hypothetical protein
MQYRIYYQGENFMIKESGWNETGNSWYVSKGGIEEAKAGSPITASTTGPPTFELVRFPDSYMI